MDRITKTKGEGYHFQDYSDYEYLHTLGQKALIQIQMQAKSRIFFILDLSIVTHMTNMICLQQSYYHQQRKE